jgi:hypothetical protein
VIVAIPPTLAGRIAYDPPLPALRDQLKGGQAQIDEFPPFSTIDTLKATPGITFSWRDRREIP